MADSSAFTEPEKRSVWPIVLGWLMFWTWTVGPRKPEDPEAQPKPPTWWSFWRWRFWSARPLNFKRSPIPSLGNLMSVDPRSMDILQLASNLLSVAFVIANMIVMSTYAAIVASHSQLPLIADLEHFAPSFAGYTWALGAVAKPIIIFLFCVVAVILAVGFQIGTDFAIVFAAALASEKYRVVPTALVFLWVGCAATTAIMEADVFTGWGRERIAEAAETTTINASDQAILDKYRNAIPPTLAQSDAAKGAAQRDLNRLQPEYERQVKARDSEEANRDGKGNGMGPKWRDIDAKVQSLGAEIATANAALSKANADHADRLEYDRADLAVKATARTTTVAKHQLLYDADPVVWTRSLLATFAPVFFVLVSFMVRGARAEQAKRREAAAKGVKTKRDNANTYEGEFEEGAAMNAPKLNSAPITEPGAVAKAATRTKATRPHPDKAGDDYGARTSGYDDADPETPAEGEDASRPEAE